MNLPSMKDLLQRLSDCRKRRDILIMSHYKLGTDMADIWASDESLLVMAIDCLANNDLPGCESWLKMTH